MVPSELKKLGSAKLRKMVEIVSADPSKFLVEPGTEKVWEMLFKGKPIGRISTSTESQVGRVGSEIEEKFRGLGLGKKMYGEVMRRMPEGKMYSDLVVSPEASRVWESLGKRKGITLEKAPEDWWSKYLSTVSKTKNLNIIKTIQDAAMGKIPIEEAKPQILGKRLAKQFPTDVFEYFLTGRGYGPNRRELARYVAQVKPEARIKTASQELMHKLSQAKLRKLIQLIVQEAGVEPAVTPLTEGIKRFSLRRSGKEIGHMYGFVDPAKGTQIGYSEVAPEFRGLGLGKKLYGEVMRMFPEGRLISDKHISEAAERVWKGMDERKGYELTVKKPSELWSVTHPPKFTATIKPEARIKTAGSKLRELVKVVRLVSPKAPDKVVFALKYKDKTIGYLSGLSEKEGFRGLKAFIQEPFRGLGLGKKLFGEAIRQVPKGTIISSPFLSSDSVRALKGILKSKAYKSRIDTANPLHLETTAVQIKPEARIKTAGSRIEQLLEKKSATAYARYLSKIIKLPEAKQKLEQMAADLFKPHLVSTVRGLDQNVLIRLLNTPASTPEELATVIKNAIRSERSRAHFPFTPTKPLSSLSKEQIRIRASTNAWRKGMQQYLAAPRGEILPGSRFFSDVHPEELIPFSHGGGLRHIQQFTAGKSPGYRLENPGRGIQVSPFREEATPEIGKFYASRVATSKVDVPAILTGKIKAKYLDPSHGGAEAGLRTEFAKNILQPKVTRIQAEPRFFGALSSKDVQEIERRYPQVSKKILDAFERELLEKRSYLADVAATMPISALKGTADFAKGFIDQSVEQLIKKRGKDFTG
ncbi:MAG: hypothetical protein KKD44_28390, partial [Proteobacteria bacterium]|nr:hypothetical protein [Pseudomonadota bacterium]